MPRLANFSIPVRIATACLLPLLAFLGFAGKDLLDARSEYLRIQQIADIAEAVPTITLLLDSLQKERGSSGGLLNNDLIVRAGEADAARAQTFVDILRTQRPETDKAIAAWQQRMAELLPRHAGSKFARDIESARAKLVDLPSIRSRIDAKTIKQEENLAFYSSITSLLAASIDEISELTDDALIARQSIALGSHVRRKEWAGQERAIGVVAIAAGEFNSANFFQMVRTRMIQDSQAANFRRYASQAQVDYVEGALKGPVTDDLARVRGLLYEVPFTKTMPVKVNQWLAIDGKYIEALKAVEDRLVAELTATARTIQADASWRFWGVL